MKGRLIDKIKRTDTVESFRFSLSKKINFIPGQFLRVIFDLSDDKNKELNKYLSFSSSPGKDYVEVTKRISRSAFSERLKDLEIGYEVNFKGPFGNCVFKDEYKKIGFLIGGVGITPVISILEHIVDNGLDTDAVLFYSNKTEEDIAFRKELDYWHTVSSNIEVFYTITDCQPKDFRCIGGRINKDLLLKKIDNLDERVFFVFGPPKMVEAMRGLCVDVGCSKENIRTESFIGY